MTEMNEAMEMSAALLDPVGGSRAVELLLVEDNHGDVQLTREALNEWTIPYRLHAVENGVDAMEFLRRRGRYLQAPRPDMILMDLNLPRKDGREVLGEIKIDPNLKRIPVLVLTTSKAKNDILLCYNLHANCYLTKPIHLAQFMQLIKTIEQFWLTHAELPSE